MSASCQPCPAASYKAGGSGPCNLCPEGSDLSKPGGSSVSICRCNFTSYTNLTGSGDLIACVPCPAHSHIATTAPVATLDDCICNQDYLRELNEGGSLDHCRKPEPCDVRQWLHEHNLTGEETHKLKLGDCARFVSDNRSLMMPDGGDCRLYCAENFAPQVDNWVRSADTLLLCSDGTIQGPHEDTVCSQAAFEVPPLVFLATITLAALIAGRRMEVRQHRFEQRCVHALKFRGCGQDVQVSDRGSKCKLA